MFITISSQHIAACPIHSLSASHYEADGRCKCHPRGKGPAKATPKDAKTYYRATAKAHRSYEGD